MTEPAEGAAHRDRTRWSRVDGTLLVAFLLLFLVSRIVWVDAQPGSSQYWEEGYRWLAIEEILAGPDLPLMDYQADHYQGGSLVVIGLGVLLGGVGVDSFVALKSVALGFSAATLAMLFLLGRVFYGRRVAVFSAAIYLVGPPLVAYWGVVAMGFHSESVFLSLVVVALFLAVSESSRRSSFLLCAFGMVSGLSIWFTPTAALAVAACALCWPIVATRPRPSELGLVVMGFGLGMAPWLLYNATHDFAGAVRLLEVFGLRESADPWLSQGLLERIGDLLLKGPTQGLLDPGGEFEGSFGMWALVIGVWVPGLAALVAAGRRAFEDLRRRLAGERAERTSDLVFMVYLALFIVVYLGSRFTIDPDPSPIAYRLLVPAAAFLILPMAVSAARSRKRVVGNAGIVLALCCLATATVGFALRHEEPGTPLTLDSGDRVWGRLLHRKFPNELDRAVALSRLLPQERGRTMLAGIGWGIEEAYGSVGELDDVEAALDRIGGVERLRVEWGMRAWANLSRKALRTSLAENENPDQRRKLERLDALAARIAPAVVLITLDTTRVDHLSCYGYERTTTPNLDGFAQRAVRYRRAWSTSSWTLPAHASLFTGLYPSRHGAHYLPSGDAVLGDVIRFPGAADVRAGMLPEESDTLAEMLADAGFRSGAFVAGPWLHRSFGLLQGFRRLDDDVTTFGGRPAAEITGAAIAWLDRLPDDLPYFLFANYFDPHAPYARSDSQPDLPRAAEDLDYDYGEVMRGEVPLDEDDRAVLVDRYDAEIREMDRSLGRLLDAIESRPNFSRTLVIITADHGEALGDGGRIGHGFWLSEELTRVPFIVRFPRGRDAGAWSDVPVQLVDVLPIVAEELDLTPPGEIEGVGIGERTSVFSELYREASTAARFGPKFDRDLEAVIEWPYKLVRSDAGDEALSRLSEDSLGESGIDDVSRLAKVRRLLDVHRSSAPAAVPVSPDADPRAVEMLRALGYIE